MDGETGTIYSYPPEGQSKHFSVKVNDIILLDDRVGVDWGAREGSEIMYGFYDRLKFTETGNYRVSFRGVGIHSVYFRVTE
ncbi:hypothetical protein FACS189483_04140 [Spirochaetia bacterium]|nr:hypothetical protein FACS189483_04140 [Spirochaetia bacterium]